MTCWIWIFDTVVQCFLMISRPSVSSNSNMHISLKSILVLLFCPPWSCTIICIIFTPLCNNFLKLTCVSAVAFRCHVHHSQCLTVLVELAVIPFLKLTYVLAEAFRCHVHHSQCLTVLVELAVTPGPSSIENDAHGIEKLLLKHK